MTKEEKAKELTIKNVTDGKSKYFSWGFYKGCLVGLEYNNKQIAELDCQKNRNKACYSCANATERCFKNEIGCPCEKYKSYKDENAELKNRNSELAGQKASLERWYGEAKKILTKFLEEEKNNMYWEMNGSDKSSYYEVRKQAKQFLSEVEK